MYMCVCVCVCMCVCVCVCARTRVDRSKISKPHPRRRAIAEHFCCGNTQALLMKLEKLIQIFLIS